MYGENVINAISSMIHIGSAYCNFGQDGTEGRLAIQPHSGNQLSHSMSIHDVKVSFHVMSREDKTPIITIHNDHPRNISGLVYEGVYMKTFDNTGRLKGIQPLPHVQSLVDFACMAQVIHDETIDLESRKIY